MRWPFWRKNHKIDSRRIDTDKDGLSDYEETAIYGTDPHDPDSDKDHVADGIEVLLGRNPKGYGRLKNLFIPNPFNNYRPEILRPKRLLFYSTVSVAIKCIVVGTVLFFPFTAYLTPDVLSGEAKRIVTLTNNVRKSVSLNALVENSKLNQAAYYKAQDMLTQQYFAHVGPDGNDLTDWLKKTNYTFTIAGENLAVGFASADEVVDAWKKSKTHYANLVDPEYREIGVGMAAGPYKGLDTTFIAQYFGTRFGIEDQVVAAEPEPQETTPAPTPAPAEPVVEPVAPQTNQNMNTATNQSPEPPKPVVANTNQNINNNGATAPKPVPTPTPKPVPKPTPKPAVTQPTPQPATPVEQTVPDQTSPFSLAEIQEETVLQQPTIVKPKDKYLTAQPEIEVVVLAPGAMEVSVYRGGEKVATQHKGFMPSDYYVFRIELQQGTQSIIAKASADNRETVSTVSTVIYDGNPPVVDLQKSNVTVLQPEGQQGKILQAEIYLSDDVAAATVSYESYTIPLDPPVARPGDNKWTGQVVVHDDREVFETITLPVLSITDKAGNTITSDVRWENVQTVKPSLLRQYFFARAHPLNGLNALLDISSWFYWFVLTIAMIALLLNIFIEIRKQYPQVILSTLGFIGLLALMIII